MNARTSGHAPVLRRRPTARLRLIVDPRFRVHLMRGIPERCLAEVCPTRGSIAAPRPTRAANHRPRPLAIAPSSARAGALEPLPTLSRGMTRRETAFGAGVAYVLHHRRVLPDDRRLAGREPHAHRDGVRRPRDGPLVETGNGYYKAELIRGPARPGRRRTVEDVELATLGWSTGTPPAGCTATSATYRRPSSRESSTLPSRPPRPGRNQSARASTRPSPVQVSSAPMIVFVSPPQQ